jgi:hypothetical protein
LAKILDFFAMNLMRPFFRVAVDDRAYRVDSHLARGVLPGRRDKLGELTFDRSRTCPIVSGARRSCGA